MSGEKGERRVLYDFWDNLPPVIVLNAPSKFMTSHPARPAVLRILREGVEEAGSEKPRHALSPKEIRKLLHERDGIEMSQTNLYFHLKKLVETGFITVVARLLEGRHRVAYYGRSARSILNRDPEESLERYRRRFQELGRLTKAKRPEFDMESLEGLAEEFLRIKQGRDREQGEWMGRNEELMTEQRIDAYTVYEFIKVLDILDPEYVAFIRKTRELLGVDL
jgi:DNA-binding transcriptional ArsR family regulator